MNEGELVELGGKYFDEYLKGPFWGVDVTEFVECYLGSDDPVDEALCAFLYNWGHGGDALPPRFVEAVGAYCRHELNKVKAL